MLLNNEFFLCFAFAILLTRMESRYATKTENKLFEKVDIKSMKNIPFIFVGGHARSGTTLMRVILDTHPDIRCDRELKYYRFLLGAIYKDNDKPINTDILNDANRLLSFLVIKFRPTHISKRVKFECVKEPPLLMHMNFIYNLFPNSKFIYLIRDGRYSVYSVIGKNKDPFDIENFLKWIKIWNNQNQVIDVQCRSLGPSICMPIRYEKFILNPKEHLENIVKFLGITWTDDFLRHDEVIKRGDLDIGGKGQWSYDQVQKPIYTDGLKPDLFKNIKGYNESLVQEAAPYLKFYGYI